MSSSFLATRHRIPPPRQHLLDRARLTDALEREIPQYKLVLLSAPAGYGKTTALTQWARASRFPVAWLSVSDEDNDLERFLRALVGSWERVNAGITETELGLRLGAQAPDLDVVLSAFLDVAAAQSEHMVFVLDDHHLLDDPQMHQALAFLLDHLPPKLHFVMAGRAAPALPLARYRARQELLEFGSADLAFSLEETGDFLSVHGGLELPEDEVVPLHEQLEGWAAALQLVALTLRNRPAPTGRLSVSGRHRFIADYLGQDVLAHVPDDVRRFLLQISILDRLCGSLCDAVSGGNDSQAMLEFLEHENLFLVPLDDEREWYRLHRLFAEFLRAELTRHSPSETAGLHRRAAAWYLTHDLPEQAFEHALAAEDVDLVIQVFERHVNVKLNIGETRLIARWLDALPPVWFASQPLFTLVRSSVLAFMGDFAACLRAIDDAEARLLQREAEETVWQLAMVRSVRCFIACIENDLGGAETYAEQALRDLREESRSFRATIYHALGDTYRRNGRWAEARACYLKVPECLSGIPGYGFQLAVESAHVFGALADLELRQGRLRAAATYWRKALASIQNPESWGYLELPAAGWVFIRLGEVLYEWNELAAAHEHLSHGLKRAELGGDARTMIAGYLLACRLSLAQGTIDEADEFLERARPLVEQAPFPEWLSRFEHVQIDLRLAQNRLRAAAVWADGALADDAFAARPENEDAQLSLARVLIFRGDLPAREQGLELLNALLEEAAREGRTGVEIAALSLQALARWRDDDRARAMTDLERALRLAEPEGYVRLFVDLGLPMARLLQEAKLRSVMPDYVASLLAAFNGNLLPLDSAPTSLPEPLTGREQEILELIAAGLTNSEIGEQLFISEQTVRKHAGNIYGKLDVHSRTEAVARARELELLS